MATHRNTDRNAEYKTLDHILDQEVTPLRMGLHKTLTKSIDPSQGAPSLFDMYNAMLNARSAEQAKQAREQLEAAVKGRFDADVFQAFVEKVEDFVAANPRMDLNAFRREKARMQSALSTGELQGEPNLRTPAVQLMWAAALGYATVNPSLQAQWKEANRSIDITRSRLWESIENSRYVENELLEHAFNLAEDIGKKDTRLRWGAPGSWFYHSPTEETVNLDLLASLTMGMEHSRSAAYHEIGHSKFTIKQPPRIQEIMAELQAQDDKIKQGNALTKEEYVQRQTLAAEMHLRHQVFNITEDNCVNQYAINRAGMQDHSVSINHFYVMMAGIGEMALQVRAGGDAQMDDDMLTRHGEGSAPGQKASDAENQKKLANVQNVLITAFFQRNGLFPNTPEGWRSVGVKPQWVTEDPNSKYATGQTPEEALQHLHSLCEQIANTQPSGRDRMFGKQNFDSKIEECADRRIELYEEIWDRYVKQFAEPLIEQAQQQAQEKVNQNQQDQEQQKDQQQEQGQQEQGEQGEGQQQGEGQEQGEDQQGEGQEQGESQEQGEGQQGQGQEGGEGGKQQGGQQGGQQQGSNSGQQQGGGDSVPVEGMGDMEDNAGKRPHDHSKEKGEEKGEGQEQGEGQSGEGKEGEGQQGEGQEGEGQGQESQGQDGQEQGQQGEGQEGGESGQQQGGQQQGGQSKGRTVEELLEERRKKQEQEAAEREAEEMQPEKVDPNQQGGIFDSEGGSSYSLQDLPVGDWRDYSARTAEYRGPINQMARILQKLRDQKVEYQKQFSRDHSLLPQDGEVGRFNPKREMERIMKEKSGRPLEDTDFERFRKDKDTPVPAEDDLVIAIDLSASMTSGQPPARRVDMAMQSACILLEAGRKAGMNVYVLGWGDKSGPRLLASPEMRPQTIGENIAGVWNGAPWGTELAPAVEGICEMMSQVKGNPNKLVGDTHMMFVSDGDLGDANAASITLQRMLKSCPKASVDVAIINDNEQTQMDKMIQQQQGRGRSKLGLVHATEPQAVQDAIFNVMRKRVQASIKEEAIPLQQKKGMFAKAVKSFKRPLENGVTNAIGM